jgi:hypothetical protein
LQPVITLKNLFDFVAGKSKTSFYKQRRESGDVPAYNFGAEKYSE